ncbi:MAG TPA: DUF1116 domain-containing protein [bacterium]|nr:DUF1116 domain-containing protein [bacterium]
MKARIDAANNEAVGRMIAAEPILVDVAPAGDVIRGLGGRTILHSGPPVNWDRMCGAQRGAVIGIIRFEGWADEPDDAVRLVERGEVRLEPNHHHQAVGPMAGTISPSLPVFIVENTTYGNRAFCRQVERRQQFGDYSDDAVSELRAWRDIFAPALSAALRQRGGLALKTIIAKALQMGDELHNRQVAASSLFANAMAVSLSQAGLAADRLTRTLGYLANHEVFFLGLAMAAAKATADPAAGIEHSTVVTAMARNGTEFGIRISGLGDQWFVAPAPRIRGLYFPGFGDADAGLDMGDSAITETVGWGGFVLGGAPGILKLVGGTLEGAVAYSRQMREITVASHPVFSIPGLGFEGAPVGIDIRKVVRTGIAPIIDTAIAHKDPGHAMIGAGLVHAPLECFEAALETFGARYALT